MSYVSYMTIHPTMKIDWYKQWYCLVHILTDCSDLLILLGDVQDQM